MEGWHPDGYPGNLAYSPELWDWMRGLGLEIAARALRPYIAPEWQLAPR